MFLAVQATLEFPLACGISAGTPVRVSAHRSAPWAQALTWLHGTGASSYWCPFFLCHCAVHQSPLVACSQLWTTSTSGLPAALQLQDLPSCCCQHCWVCLQIRGVQVGSVTGVDHTLEKVRHCLSQDV